jgi:hypothetical protein
VGFRSELRIERSAAGRPGLMFIIDDYEIDDHANDRLLNESCIVVDDGSTVLAPVIDWLSGSTAAGDRHTAARAALAEWDRPTQDIIGDDGFPIIGTVERAEWVIKALRALVTPA